MEKDPNQLAQQIISLISELAELAGKKIKKPITFQPKTIKRKLAGVTGGLRVLVNGSYFNKPKLLSEIIEKLRQEGRYYSNAAVSMGLLNLVRERILSRFKKRKHWNYIIRR